MKLLKYILVLILIQSFISCQEVEINKNEIGVHFKRFGGGIDTTKNIQPGKHSIPNWDYITTYQIDKREGEFEYVNVQDKKYKIEYIIELNKEKVALYHNYIGGNPTKYAEQGIVEYLDKISTRIIQEFIDQNSKKQFENYKKAVGNYYINLLELRITEVTKE